MTDLAVFGPMLDTDQIEQAVIDTVELWSPTYLRAVERSRPDLDPGDLPLIQSYSTVNEFFKWNEDQLPACVVISPGTAPRPPKMEGDGTYRAWYRVGVAIISTAEDRETTRRLSKLYVAAFRSLLLQHQSLGDFADGISWTGERNSDVPDEFGRTLGSGAMTFDVEIRNVVNARLGPLVPADDPDAEPSWPQVQDPIETAVEHKEDA